jgi:hypothetical protein
MSLPAIETTCTLTQRVLLPAVFIEKYAPLAGSCRIIQTSCIGRFVQHCMHCCENQADASRQRRDVRILCVFIQSLMSSKVLQFNAAAFRSLFSEVDAFCLHFSAIKDASELAKQIRKFSHDASK